MTNIGLFFVGISISTTPVIDSYLYEPSFESNLYAQHTEFYVFIVADQIVPQFSVNSVEN